MNLSSKSHIVKLSDLIRAKISTKEELSSKLDRKERREALRDGHARREPRPCGLTVHPGRGCSFGCLYCYIWDMGAPKKPEPYHLDGLQLAYAIASNPYTLIGKEGTFLALGSITEPFLPRIRERTLEYLEAIRMYLGNPSQFSTKSYLGEEDVKVIKGIDPSISALITITTLELAEKLEPNAPSPYLRFKSIRNLRDAGMHVTLFMRPLIPGISEGDGPRIMEMAAQFGARGVVFGTLRVTRSIIARLNGVGIKELESRMARKPRGERDQVPINEGEVKRKLIIKAKELGLKVYPSACSANADAHSLPCYMCNMGPCGSTLPDYDPEELEQALTMIGIEAKVSSVGQSLVVGVKAMKKAGIVKHLLSTATKRKIRIEPLS